MNKKVELRLQEKEDLAWTKVSLHESGHILLALIYSNLFGIEYAKLFRQKGKKYKDMTPFRANVKITRKSHYEIRRYQEMAGLLWDDARIIENPQEIKSPKWTQSEFRFVYHDLMILLVGYIVEVVFINPFYRWAWKNESIKKKKYHSRR